MLSEAIVVAAALLGDAEARRLAPEDVRDPALRAVQRAVLSTPEPVDVGLVAQALPGRLGPRHETPVEYLGRLMSTAPASSQLATHVALVREGAARRRVADRLRSDAATLGEAELGDWAERHVRGVVEAAAVPGAGWETVTGAPLAEPVPPVPWLCEPMQLAPGRPIILAAYGGSGKTWLACELALALATGRREVLGGAWRLAASCPVLHLNFEMPHQALMARYQRLAQGTGADLASAELHLASRGQLGGDTLTTPTFASTLTDTVRRTGAGLVVIDSLRAATAGIDENSSDSRKCLDLLLGVSDATGTTVLVIHHEGKPPTQGQRETVHRLRGSSALVDACDATWHLRAQDGALVLEPGKTSRGGRPEPVTVSLVDGAHGAIAWSYRCPEEEAQRASADADRREREALDRIAESILRALVRHGPLTATEITDGTRHGIVGRRTVRRDALRRMLADGAIVQGEGGPRGAKVYRSALRSAGPDRSRPVRRVNPDPGPRVPAPCKRGRDRDRSWLQCKGTGYNVGQCRCGECRQRCYRSARPRRFPIARCPDSAHSALTGAAVGPGRRIHDDYDDEGPRAPRRGGRGGTNRGRVGGGRSPLGRGDAEALRPRPRGSAGGPARGPVGPRAPGRADRHGRPRGGAGVDRPRGPPGGPLGGAVVTLVRARAAAVVGAAAAESARGWAIQVAHPGDHVDPVAAQAASDRVARRYADALEALGDAELDLETALEHALEALEGAARVSYAWGDHSCESRARSALRALAAEVAAR